MAETISEYTVRKALEEIAQELSELRAYVDRAERDGRDPQGVHEFAVRAYPTASRGAWLLGSDEDLAAARRRMARVAGRGYDLNRGLGTERVEVVSRWRFELPDGTTITTPWLAYEED